MAINQINKDRIFINQVRQIIMVYSLKNHSGPVLHVIIILTNMKGNQEITGSGILYYIYVFYYLSLKGSASTKIDESRENGKIC